MKVVAAPYALCVLLVVLALLNLVMPVDAEFKLKFRSKQLSNIMSGRSSSNNKSSVKDEAPKTSGSAKSPDFLRLDLSGRLQILLAGQEEEMPSRVVKPLFSFKESLLSPFFVPLRVNLGIDCDFAQSTLGLLRAVPECTWGLFWPATLRKHSPNQFDLAAEKGIAEGVTDALEARLWWKPSSDSLSMSPQPLPSLRMRCEKTGLGSLSCTVPLLRRITYEGTLSRNIWGSGMPLAVPKATTMNQDWWLPDLSINSIGNMQANKQIWIGPEAGAPRYGFRFAIRRNLEWSIWNTSVDPQQDAKTYISVQLDASARRWRTGARIESTLEEPLRSAQLNLSTHMRLGLSEN